MQLLDPRTVVVIYTLSNIVCLTVVALLWRQNRKRFEGLAFWLADFVLQFLGLLLVSLRGRVPDELSMTGSNFMVVGGTVLLYIGLERFTGRRTRQVHNYLLLAVFGAAHLYFSFVLPSLAVRNLLLSLGLLALCAQCAWLMLRRVGREDRPITRGVGHVFVGFCLISLGRVVVTLVAPPEADFFRSNAFDTLLLVAYQILYIILTFSLFLMINLRLFDDLRRDVAARTRTEEALTERVKELRCIYNLSNLVHGDASLDEILRGSVELLPPAMRYPEFACARIILWERVYTTCDYQDSPRKISCEILRNGATIGALEVAYRQALPLADAAPFLPEEIALLRDVAYRLGRAAERLEASEALRRSEERYQTFIAHSFEAIYRIEFDQPIDIALPAETQVDQIYASAFIAECNQAMAGMYRFPSVGALIGARLLSIHGGPDHPVNRAALRKFIEGAYKSTADETRELDGDGRPIWFLHNTIGIVEAGLLVRIWGTAIDITERKRAEALLESQNRTLVALHQTTLDLLSELDLDTLLGNVVRRAGSLFGTDSGYIYLVDPETGRLRPRVGLGALAESFAYVIGPGQDVAGLVWQTGEPAIVDDYDRWPGRIDGFSRGTIRSIAAVPLLSAGKVLGVLGTAHAAGSGRVFTEADLNLLTQFASLVTIAIENARLYLAAQQDLAESRQVEAIIRLRLRLWEYAALHSIEQLMQKALDEIEVLTGSVIGFYHFVEEDQNSLTLKAWSTGTRARFCKAEGEGMHYPIDQAGVWVDCIKQRMAVIHNDYASLPHRKGLPEGHARIVRELVVPTLRDGRVVSVLGVGNKAVDYDAKDVELVSYIADVVWSIVERKQSEDRIRELNARLERLAMTDELTGLYNRRAFFLRGEDEVRRAQRYCAPLSLVMLDIDGFKKINDTYGHDAGDLMLQCVARVLRESAREIDAGARLGGEEFAILLPSTSAAEAVVLAERLRAAIAGESCAVRERAMGVTVSVGVASYEQSEDITGLEAILRRADAAMYRAKNQGRNRVVLFSE